MCNFILSALQFGTAQVESRTEKPVRLQVDGDELSYGMVRENSLASDPSHAECKWVIIRRKEREIYLEVKPSSCTFLYLQYLKNLRNAYRNLAVYAIVVANLACLIWITLLIPTENTVAPQVQSPDLVLLGPDFNMQGYCIDSSGIFLGFNLCNESGLRLLALRLILKCACGLAEKN